MQLIRTITDTALKSQAGQCGSEQSREFGLAGRPPSGGCGHARCGGPRRRSKYLAGLLCLLLAIVLVLPVPLGNMPSALDVFLFALGITGRDWLWILAGFAVAVAFAKVAARVITIASLALPDRPALPQSQLNPSQVEALQSLRPAQPPSLTCRMPAAVMLRLVDKPERQPRLMIAPSPRSWSAPGRFGLPS